MLLSDAALSYMLRKRFERKHIDAIYREAQKTIKKIARTMIAIVDKNIDALDRHTRSVLRQAYKLGDSERFYSYDELKSMQSTSVTTGLSASLNMSERHVIAQSTLSAQTPTSVHAIALLKLATCKIENARKFVRFDCERKEIAFVTQRADDE